MKKFMRLTAALAMLAAASVAQADLNGFGPLNVPAPPGNGFPAWYQDLNGLALDLCVADAVDPGSLQATACLLVGAGVPTPPLVFPTNWPVETFYFRGVSTPFDTSDPNIGTATGLKAVYVSAVEAGFPPGLPPTAGQQVTFTRLRVTAGVPHPGTWTVKHPYGTETFVVDVATGARDIFFTEDVGAGAVQQFGLALTSRVGPFLLAVDPVTLAVKPNVVLNGVPFLSDGVIQEQVTGSPFGTNFFQLCGPYDGLAITCRQANTFTLTGRVHTAPIASPLTVDRATYSRNAGVAQVDVSAIAKPGIGQAAPTLTAAADTVSPVLMNGPTVLGEWYAQGIPVPVDAIPSVLTVINSSDVPPSSVTSRLTDIVTVKSANYSPAAGGSLVVVATSSDKGNPASVPAIPPAPLRLEGFPAAVITLTNGGVSGPPDAAETTFTVAPLPVPPPTVRVSSTVGGQGIMDTVMAVGPAFPAGVPLAVNDNASATAGGAAVIIPVIPNDFLPVGPALAVPPVAIVTAPALGTAVANADGTITYTPPAATAGTATFTYTLANAVGKSNVATVTVAVAPNALPAPIAANDPAAGTISVIAGSVTPISVLANDSANGGTIDPASLLVTGVTGGTVAVNLVTGVVTYTAGNIAGTFGFSYTVANTNGQRSNVATVSVTVTGAEIIQLKSGTCVVSGSQWSVSGTSTFQTGSVTLYNVSPVPAAPTAAQIITTQPLVRGTWSYQAKPGPVCVARISIKSTNGGVLNGAAIQVK